MLTQQAYEIQPYTDSSEILMMKMEEEGDRFHSVFFGQHRLISNCKRITSSFARITYACRFRFLDIHSKKERRVDRDK